MLKHFFGVSITTNGYRATHNGKEPDGVDRWVFREYCGVSEITVMKPMTFETACKSVRRMAFHGDIPKGTVLDVVRIADKAKQYYPYILTLEEFCSLFVVFNTTIKILCKESIDAEPLVFCTNDLAKRRGIKPDPVYSKYHNRYIKSIAAAEPQKFRIVLYDEEKKL